MPGKEKDIVVQSRDRIELDVELIGGTITLNNEQKWIWVQYIGGESEDYIDVLKLLLQALKKLSSNSQ